MHELESKETHASSITRLHFDMSRGSKVSFNEYSVIVEETL